MSDALDSAKLRRKAIIREQRSLAYELTKVEDFIENWHLFACLRPTSTRSKTVNTNIIAEAACEIIQGVGHPIRRNDLFHMISERGYVLKAANPISLFTTKIWRSRDRIVNLRGFGYWLADRPYEPAGYRPT